MSKPNLTDGIIAILTSYDNHKLTKKSFSPREIVHLLKEYTENEVSIELESIVRRNLFVKKKVMEDKSLEYWYELFTPTKEFLDKIITYTSKILKENPIHSKIEMETILKLHALSFTQLRVLYPNYQILKDASIRQIISSLNLLHILKANANSCYYLDLLYFDAHQNLASEIALDKFWQCILNYENIQKIEVHGLFFKSHKRLKMDNAKLDQNWEKQKGKAEIWIKEVDIPCGRLKFQVYSNKDNPDLHTLHVHYEGSLLLINVNKQKDRGKFAVNINDFGKLINYIESEFYKLEISKDFTFHYQEFQNFTLESLGFNIDTDLNSIPFIDVHLSNDITMRDFLYHYTLRFYQYHDKFDNKDYLRFDSHFDKPNSYNITGFLDALSSFSHNILNPHINHQVTEQLVHHTTSEITNLDKNMGRFTDSLNERLKDITTNISDSNKNQNLNAVALSDSTQKIESKISREIGDIQKIVENVENGFSEFTEKSFESFKQASQNTITVLEKKIDDISDSISEREVNQNEVIDQLKDNILSLTDNLNQNIQTQSISNKNTQQVLEKLTHNLSEITSFIKEQVAFNKQLREENKTMQENLQLSIKEQIDLNKELSEMKEKKKSFLIRWKEKRKK